MPIWAYCYLAFMCLIIPFGVFNHIKKRKSTLYLTGETLCGVFCFLVLISYWNKSLSTFLGFTIVPQTIFIIIWGIYSTQITIKDEGAKYADMGDFNKSIFWWTSIILAPIYILGAKQSIGVLGY